MKALFIQLIYVGYHRGYRGSNEDLGPWGAVAYLTPFVIAGVGFFWMYYRNNKRNQYWSSGVFPAALPDTPYNRMMAYICIAASLLRRDRLLMVSKLGYVDAYFRHYFKDSYSELKEQYSQALKHAVKPASLVSWFNQHLEETERTALLTFLVELAFYDGSMNAAEYDLIRYLSDEMKLDSAKLDKLIQDHERRYKEQYREAAATTSESLKERHAHTLGLEKGFTYADVKKAYRRLAMIYHPDKYQKDSPEVREKAGEKFLEIQRAYEYFEGTFA